MDTQKRKTNQDIYSSDSSDKDLFTPQKNVSVAQERKRDLKRQQGINFTLGLLALIISVSLVYIIINNYIENVNEVKPLAPITDEYIPRYALEQEDQWVLDYNRTFAKPTEETTEPQSNTMLWIKKAAYNIILAEKAYELQNYKEAATHFENARAIIPDLEDVRAPLGMCYFNLEQFDDAIELFKDINLDDLDETMLSNLGAVCIQSEAYDLAETYLKAAEEKNSVYAPLLKNFAQLYREKEEHDQAITYFNRYFFQRPNDTDSRYDYALYLTKQARWQLASEEIDILTQDITDIANLYNLQARIELKLGNAEKALLATRRAAQLSDPKNAIQWMNDNEFDQLRNVDEFSELMKYRSN